MVEQDCWRLEPLPKRSPDREHVVRRRNGNRIIFSIIANKINSMQIIVIHAPISQPLNVRTTLAKAELSEPIQKSEQSSILRSLGNSQNKPPMWCLAPAMFSELPLSALEACSPPLTTFSWCGDGSKLEHLTSAKWTSNSDPKLLVWNESNSLCLISNIECAYSNPKRTCWRRQTSFHTPIKTSWWYIITTFWSLNFKVNIQKQQKEKKTNATLVGVNNPTELWYNKWVASFSW